MTSIVLVVVSFVTAVFEVLHDHRERRKNARLLGLTHFGLMLLVMASIGTIVGVAKEIGNTRSDQERDRLLRDIHAQVLGLSRTTQNQAQAERLRTIADGINAAASRSRASDFSFSDLSRSEFNSADFTGADFANALFTNANLSGADLSAAHIDARTRLPQRHRTASPLAQP